MSAPARVVVITGASSGIGAEAARRLAESGARVAVVGRNPERTASVAERVGGEPFVADFDRFADVRELGTALLDRYERIDVLAHNAGGVVAKRATTADGHERTIQSNVLSAFLLTRMLLPRLIESADLGAGVRPRILFTSSIANRWGDLRLDDLDWLQRRYLGGWRAYGTAKLADILLVRELAERLVGTGVDAYAFHPGVIATRFGNDFGIIRAATRVTGGRWASASVEEGAAPLIALASDAPLGVPSGTYFDRLTPYGAVNRQARDPRLGSQLWDQLERIVPAA